MPGGIGDGLGLLTRPDFARLFTAYLITYSGNAMTPIAMAFGVLELTGSTRDSSLVIAAPTVAQIMMLSIGGALADRTARQRLMVSAESLAATSQITIATLFLTGYASVPVLILLMLVNGVAVALNVPATTGFITQVVQREELQAANALLGAARNGAMTMGAALGGVMVATFGAGITIAVDAATFAVAAVLIGTMTVRTQAPAEKASLLTDLRLGWNEFIAHQWLWSIVLQFSIIVAGFAAVFGLLGPAITRQEMNGAVDWGFIAASYGIGMISGGLLAMKVKVIRPMLFGTHCMFLWAAVPLALSVLAPIPVVVLAAFMSGMGAQMFFVLWYTTLQKEIPGNLLSRVAAYDHLGSIALAPLGIVAGGFLFELLGGQTTLLIAAATIIVPTALVLMVPGVRQLRAT